MDAAPYILLYLAILAACGALVVILIHWPGGGGPDAV